MKDLKKASCRIQQYYIFFSNKDSIMEEDIDELASKHLEVDKDGKILTTARYAARDSSAAERALAEDYVNKNYIATF